MSYQEVAAMISEYEAFCQKFKAEMQEKVKPIFKKFFEENPAVKAILWTQYTPYFNDGDTCEFRVGTPTFTNAGPDDIDDVTTYGDYDGDNESVWAFEGHYGLRYLAPEIKSQINEKAIKALSNLLDAGSMEDVWRAMFGDHVKVVATSEGFDVEDFDHE